MLEHLPLIVFLVTFVLIFVLRMPIPAGMIAACTLYFLTDGLIKGVGFGALITGAGGSLHLVAQKTIEAIFTNGTIVAVPLFIFAANVMNAGKITEYVFGTCMGLVGRFRGGLAHVNVLASLVFSGMTGSAIADASGLGKLEIDAVRKEGYDDGFSCAITAASATIGPIFPPSIPMVVYAMLTGASVGDMFKSGMGIGIGIMIVLMIVVIVLAHKEQWPKDEIHFNLKEFCISFLKAIPALMLPIIILGGIYSGLLTATESSAIAVVWSFIAGMFIYRELKWSDLFDIFVDSAKSSAMTLFIIATSTAFAWLFAYAGISKQLVDFVVGMHLSATMYCLVVALILLIFGTFLEGIATAVLLVPVLWPVAQALGVNVIHFGMIVSIANVVGTMTPPVAVNIFSAASVTKLSMGKIVHGQWPFFIGYVGFFFLVVFIPALSTFLL